VKFRYTPETDNEDGYAAEKEHWKKMYAEIETAEFETDPGEPLIAPSNVAQTGHPPHMAQLNCKTCKRAFKKCGNMAGRAIRLSEVHTLTTMATQCLEPKKIPQYLIERLEKEFKIMDANESQSDIGIESAQVTQKIVNTTVDDNHESIDTSAEDTTVFWKLQDPYPNITPVAMLQRVFQLSNATLSSADTFDQIIKQIYLPYDIIDALSNRRVLDNFQFVAGDIEVEFRMNTNMMQYGLYAITFLPGYFSTDTVYPERHFRPLQGTKTVLLDIATSKTVKMRIPMLTFMTSYPSYNTDNAHVHAGTIYVKCLTAIHEAQVTTPVAATLTSWIRFIDPQAFGFVAQMDSEESEGMAKSPNNALSATLDRFGKIFASLSMLPYASQVGPALSTLAHFSAGVARYLGHSMSRSFQGRQDFVQNVISPVHVFHGSDNSAILALSTSSKLATDGIVQMGMDDQLFDNFKLFPGYIGEFIMSTTTTTNTLLYTIPVTPYDAHNAVPHYDITPVSMLSEMHTFWRGSMKYHLRAICNRFTTARLVVIWKVFGSDPVADINRYPQFVSKVWDINGPSTLSFTVPFLTFFPALRCLFDGDVTTCINGQLAIYNLNTLQVMGSEPQDLHVHVWKSGGEDLVFSLPRDFRYSFVESESEFENIAQGDEDECDLREHFRNRFPALIDGAHDVVLDKVVMTDVASSFVERFSKPIYWKNLTCAASTWTTLNLNDLFFDPESPFSMLTALFVAHRGSVRIKLIPITNGLDIGNDVLVYVRAKHPGGNNLPTTVVSVASTAVFNLNHQLPEVLVPYYRPFLFMTPGFLNGQRSSTLPWTLEVNSEHIGAYGNLSFKVLVSVGDDYRCSIFSGVPRVYIP
jgi:hypothetical protein